jgi:CRP/FNR family transcriptional regulator, cyclic AMP receptor protein
MNTEIAIENGSKTPTAKYQDLRELITAHPFFKGLRQDHIDALIDCAMKVEFKAGELIFREGDHANRFYLILKGEIGVEANMDQAAPARIETIGAGDVLGWSWLVEPYEWHFDARATRPTLALFFYGTWLRELYEENPKLENEMQRRVGALMKKRLEAAWRRMLTRCPAGMPPQVGTSRELPLKSGKGNGCYGNVNTPSK